MKPPKNSSAPRNRSREYRPHCRCGVSWESLTWAHCSTCHLTFTGVSGFDAHRFQDECLDPKFLRSRNGVATLVERHPGVWGSPRDFDEPATKWIGKKGHS